MTPPDSVQFDGSDLEAVLSGERNAAVGFEDLREFTVGDIVPVLDGETGEEVATIRIEKTAEVPLANVPATMNALDAKTSDQTVDGYREMLESTDDRDVDRSTPVRVLVWSLTED